MKQYICVYKLCSLSAAMALCLFINPCVADHIFVHKNTTHINTKHN